MENSVLTKIEKLASEFEKLTTEYSRVVEAIDVDALSGKKDARKFKKRDEIFKSIRNVDNEAREFALAHFLTLSDDLKEVTPITRKEFETKIAGLESAVSYYQNRINVNDGIAKDAFEKGSTDIAVDRLSDSLSAAVAGESLQTRIESLKIAALEHEFPDDREKQTKAWAPTEKGSETKKKSKSNIELY